MDLQQLTVFLEANKAEFFKQLEANDKHIIEFKGESPTDSKILNYDIKDAKFTADGNGDLMITGLELFDNRVAVLVDGTERLSEEEEFETIIAGEKLRVVSYEIC